MNVYFSELFSQQVKNFPVEDQLKIRQFEQHVKKYGLVGLKGRNKASANVHKDDPNWSDKVAYAQKYQLWHYHIGIPEYRLSHHGDLVSEYILHYILADDHIKIVDLSFHPPFRLPDLSYLV